MIILTRTKLIMTSLLEQPRAPGQFAKKNRRPTIKSPCYRTFIFTFKYSIDPQEVCARQQSTVEIERYQLILFQEINFFYFYFYCSYLIIWPEEIVAIWDDPNIFLIMEFSLVAEISSLKYCFWYFQHFPIGLWSLHKEHKHETHHINLNILISSLTWHSLSINVLNVKQLS